MTIHPPPGNRTRHRQIRGNPALPGRVGSTKVVPNLARVINSSRRLFSSDRPTDRYMYVNVVHVTDMLTALPVPVDVATWASILNVCCVYRMPGPHVLENVCVWIPFGHAAEWDGQQDSKSVVCAH